MFKFKLEPLLRYRQQIEETLQKELATLRQAIAKEKQILLVQKKKKTEYLATLDRFRHGHHTAAEVLPYYRFIDRISHDIERQRQRVRAVRRQLDVKRGELLDAVKKRKTIDRLKDKAAAAYRQQQQQQEQKMMNDVATQQYFRNH
jgi:flagellar FliJ protein